MITPEQELWLSKLNDSDFTEITDFDPGVLKVFERIKNRIDRHLGDNFEVLLMGSAGLGILGKGELDIYIPVLPNQFNETVNSVSSIYGKPKSLYPLERARFIEIDNGVLAEIFVINKECQGWIDSCKFENYLRENEEALEEYKKLKKETQGLSGREYYRRKIEFINHILGK